MATACVVIADVIGAGMMVPKTYRDPESETLVTFVFASLGGALAAGAVGAPGRVAVAVPRLLLRHQRCDRAADLDAPRGAVRHHAAIASYIVNERAVARARERIEARQYVLDSNWGDMQPNAAAENAYLESHSWDEYAEWHLALTDGATDETKARYAFVYGDFRRVHRMGLIACLYRAAEWRHKEVMETAYDLLQYLDETSG